MAHGGDRSVGMDAVAMALRCHVPEENKAIDLKQCTTRERVEFRQSVRLLLSMLLFHNTLSTVEAKLQCQCEIM